MASKKGSSATMAHSEYQSNPFALLRPTVTGVRLNAKTYLLLALATCGIILAWVLFAGAATALVMGKGAGPWIGGLGLIVAGGLAVWLSVIFAPVSYRFSLAVARGQRISFREAIQPSWRLGWQITIVNLLSGLIILGGYVLLIVPGLIFSAWYSLAGYLVIDEGLTGWAALRRSKELAAHRFWDVWGALALPSIFYPIRLFPFIGQLVYLVVTLILMPLPAQRYHQLRELKTASDEADTAISKWNYLVFVIMLLTLAWSTADSISQFNQQSKVENTRK